MNLHSSLAATALSLAAAPAAFAGPLDASLVPDGTTWVLHLDLEQFRGSAIGGALLAELAQRKEGADLKKFSNVVGFDLEQNLLDATFFGKGIERESATIVVDVLGGTGNLEGLMLAAPEYQSQIEDGRTIHSFIAKDEERGDARMFVAMQPLPGAGAGASNETRILAAYDVGVLHQALDQMAVEAEAPRKSEASPTEGSMLFLLVEEIDPAVLAASGGQSAVLRMIDGLSLDLSEAEERVRLTAQASVTDEPKAEQLRQLVQGLFAMAQLGDMSQPGPRMVAEMAKRAAVKKDATVVSVSLDAGADEILAAAKLNAR